MKPTATNLRLACRPVARRALHPLAIACGAIASIASAQNPDPRLKIHRSPSTGLATFVTAADGGPIPAADGPAHALTNPDDFLHAYGALFGLTDARSQLTLERVRRDQWNGSHATYHQVHKGVPVFSGMLKVHHDARGQIVAANGRFHPFDPSLEIDPILTPDEAVAVASQAIESAHPLVERRELVIVDPGWYGDPPTGPHLAYHVILADLDAALHEAFFIDAITGKVLDQWSLLEHAIDRRIHDGLATAELPGLLARAEGDPPYPDQDDVNRAYDYFGDTYDYFFRAFGRDSLDDLGMPLVATVNSRAPGCPNAFWSSSRLQMAFCKFTVADDVAAHELTHGLTNFTARLIYQNQSGQLNESFSDVFGELVDLFNGDAAFPVQAGPPWPAHPTGPGSDFPNNRRAACSRPPDYPDGFRWLVSEDALAFGGPIRDMWDPTCRGHPDRANSELQTCGPGDNGGVHSGSGVPNHAFAIAVDGKTFNGFTVRGVGPIKAGAVWYRALTTYLTPSSDFQDAYLALTRSARDLVGKHLSDPRTGFPIDDLFTDDDAIQIDLALQAVEMNTPGRCGRTVAILDPRTPPMCGDAAIIFEDDFETDSRGWRTFHNSPPTPYSWVLTKAPLPFGRPGRAWFCDDPGIGDCRDVDESALHSLVSPPIPMPAFLQFPLLRFTHYLDTELGYDGGNVSIRVNGGPWRAIRGEHFLWNPYNSVLRAGSYNNTSPLAGAETWNGVGGRWGTSVIDLKPYVAPGDLVEIRFDFGKDGCAGRDGWYVDDVIVYDCRDCNRNDRNDEADLRFAAWTPTLRNIGVNSPRHHVFTALPESGGDVLLRVSAIGDLFGELRDESLFISLNGSLLAEVFVDGAVDCPTMPNVEELTIPVARFNAAVATGKVRFDVVASSGVNPFLCGGSSWVRLGLEYPTRSADLDDDGVPDECQHCATPPAPVFHAEPVTANRYIAFTPRTNGRTLAFRVRSLKSDSMTRITPEWTMWIGPPEPLDPGANAAHSPKYARLRCDPFFSPDWTNESPILLYGPEIRPGARYAIDAIDLACAPGIHPGAAPRAFAPESRYFSPVLSLSTSRWGDVGGGAGGAAPPDAKVDLADVAAVVDRFAGVPGAVSRERADLCPASPDGIVDFQDIACVIDAFRDVPFPFASAPRCPK